MCKQYDPWSDCSPSPYCLQYRLPKNLNRRKEQITNARLVGKEFVQNKDSDLSESMSTLIRVYPGTFIYLFIYLHYLMRV